MSGGHTRKEPQSEVLLIDFDEQPRSISPPVRPSTSAATKGVQNVQPATKSSSSRRSAPDPPSKKDSQASVSTGKGPLQDRRKHRSSSPPPLNQMNPKSPSTTSSPAHSTRSTASKSKPSRPAPPPRPSIQPSLPRKGKKQVSRGQPRLTKSPLQHSPIRDPPQQLIKITEEQTRPVSSDPEQSSSATPDLTDTDERLSPLNARPMSPFERAASSELHPKHVMTIASSSQSKPAPGQPQPDLMLIDGDPELRDGPSPTNVGQGVDSFTLVSAEEDAGDREIFPSSKGKGPLTSSPRNTSTSSAAAVQQGSQGSSRERHPSTPEAVLDKRGTSSGPEVESLVPPQPSDMKPKQLSGYLGWLESQKLRKQWKNRWFRLDEHIGKLFYYENKADLVPLGFLDLSNASFSFDVERPNSGKFSIVTPTHTYQLRAQNRDTMRYWLDQLQKKRKHLLSKDRLLSSQSSDPRLGPVASDDLGGLVGEELDTTPPANEGAGSEEEEEEVPESVDLNKPVSVENRRNILDSLRKSLKGGSEKPKLPGGEDGSKFYVPSPQETYTNPAVESHLSAATTRPNTGTGTGTTDSPHHSPALRRKVNFPSFRRQADCPKCSDLKLDVKALYVELREKAQEVADRDTICDFLRAEIRRYDTRQQALEKLLKTDAKELLDSTAATQETLATLTKTLDIADYDKQLLEDRLDKSATKIQELEEQMVMYKETVKAKDDVVVQLTNEIDILKNKGHMLVNPREALFPVSVADLEREIQKLKESVDAYRDINIFLSKEVTSLQELRSADSDRILELTDKNADLRAEVQCMESKLTVLINEREAPKLTAGSEEVSAGDEVSSRLKEAMESGTLRSAHLENSTIFEQPDNSAWNVSNFGFKSDPDADSLSISMMSFDRFDPRDEDPTTAAVQTFSPEQSRKSLEQDWIRFLRNHGSIEADLPKVEDLKFLIRRGIPNRFRAQIWRACIKDILKKSRHTYVADGYKELLKTNVGSTSTALGQIELDLLRTLPNNIYFDSPEAKGVVKLRRILVAYSYYNPEVGYCQGLNRLAAIALLFLDEEWAFWCLVAIVQCTQPRDYYTKHLVGSQADQRVLQQLLLQKAPRLACHLNACNIDYLLITFNWFLTVFVDNIPPELMIRIWDAFLYEGTKVLFRYAIAIFKYHEDSLMRLEDPIKLYSFLRKMSMESVNIHRLSMIAFSELNPFPMKKINDLRMRFLPEMQQEVDELEKLREEHLNKRMSRVMSTQNEVSESPFSDAEDEEVDDAGQD